MNGSITICCTESLSSTTPPFFKRIYNGVLLDEALIAQSSAEDLVKLELLKKILPCHSMLYSPSPSLDIDLATFCETCKRFPARSTRQLKRANINLAAPLSSNNDFEIPMAATALNVSQNGCFLATLHQQKVGNRVWLNLDGLKDSPAAERNPLVFRRGEQKPT